jgi:hypothetical protein
MNEEMLAFCFPGSYEDETGDYEETCREDIQDALTIADYEPEY